MTIQQVADALGITPQRVYVYCRAGRLGVRVGKHWVITREDFERFKAASYTGLPGRRAEHQPTEDEL
jgi:excisionase family DNA binding protein